jgi:2-methylcitrate dehydratase PrpD
VLVIIKVRYFQQSGQAALTVKDVLTGIVQAYEIQGMLSFANKFDQPAIGLDHVIGVKIACSIVLTKLLGGSQENAKAALGNSWMDGGTLNAYRHVAECRPS